MKHTYTKLVAKVTLPATKGKKTIAKDGTELFAYVDTDFKAWSGKEKEAGAGTFAVHELTKDATYEQAFSSLGHPENLVMTQEQVLDFCTVHKPLLGRWACWFLLRGKDGELFVCRARVLDDGTLGALADRFGLVYVWYADRGHRVVVPKEPLKEFNTPEGVPYPAYYDVLNVLIRDYNERNRMEFRVGPPSPWSCEKHKAGGSHGSCWQCERENKIIPPQESGEHDDERDLAHRICDIFFDSGARIGKSEYDKVKSLLNENA